MDFFLFTLPPPLFLARVTKHISPLHCLGQHWEGTDVPSQGHQRGFTEGTIYRGVGGLEETSQNW